MDIDKQKIAAACGVTLRHIDYILSGQRRPSPDLALKIEQVTNGEVTRDELLFPDLHQPKGENLCKKDLSQPAL